MSPSSICPGGGSTAATRVTFQDRALRSCSQNAVTIACTLLSDDTNERIFRIIHRCTAPLLAWDVEHRRTVHHAEACESFMVEQAAGAFMEHCCHVAASLTTHLALTNCQFCVSREEGRLLLTEPGELVTEDDFASIMGQFTWTLVAERAVRAL